MAKGEKPGNRRQPSLITECNKLLLLRRYQIKCHWSVLTWDLYFF